MRGARDDGEQEGFAQALSKREASDGERRVFGAVDVEEEIGHGSASGHAGRHPG
jgi:hypothetical protein